MLALRIFTHSLRQVTGNLLPALQVSLVPMVIQNFVLLTAGGGILTDPQALDAAARAGNPPIAAMALVVGTTIVCSTWMAVAWHRFVLAGERPHGFLPRPHGERMLAYVGRSLLLGLVLAAVTVGADIPIGLVAALAGGVAPTLAVIIATAGGIVLIVVLAVVLMRLSPMLPAAALGAESTLRMAWGATRGKDPALFALAFLLVAFTLLLSLPQVAFSSLGLTIFAIAAQIAAGWFAGLVLLSVFTTLYGHFVQHRPLVVP